MGVFSVEIGLRNWQNRFLAAEEQGEDVVCNAVVDTGASDLCLPADIVERLKLTQVGETRLLLADGEYHNRQPLQQAHECVFTPTAHRIFQHRLHIQRELRASPRLTPTYVHISSSDMTLTPTCLPPLAPISVHP